MVKTIRATHLLLAAAALLSCLAACKRTQQPGAGKAPEQLELKPAAAARADLVAEVAFASFDRTVANVETVAKKMGLPVSADNLKKMLTARSRLPEALVDSIDRTKPAAAAIILVPKKEAGDAAPREAAEPVIAMSLKTPGQAGFDAFVALLGKAAERSRDAVRVQPGDAGGMESPLWMLPRDGAVCMAEQLDRLTAGCALALEARKAAAQDLRIVLIPEGMARAAGTTLKEALAKARAELAAEQARAQAALTGKDAQLQASAGKLAEGMLGSIFDAVSDTTEGRIAVALDPTKGLTTTFEAVPRSGSALAKTVAPRHAYSVDPALAAGSPGSLWAMGDMSFARTMFQSMRGPLLEMITPESDRAKAGPAMDALFEALSGPFSARFAFDGGPKLGFAYDVVYTMKPGTDGKKLLGEVESLMKAPWLSKLFDAAFQGMMKVKLTSKRDGEALVTQVVADTKKMPADMRTQMKTLPFFDGKPMEARMLVQGEKMIVGMGGATKARLTALAAGTVPAPPSPELTAALAETKGEDAIYYTDLAAVLRPVFSLAAGGAMTPKGPEGMQATAMAGAMATFLQNAHLGTWGSYRGGETALLSWRIPMGTFESVGGIVRAAMGGR